MNVQKLPHVEDIASDQYGTIEYKDSIVCFIMQNIVEMLPCRLL